MYKNVQKPNELRSHLMLKITLRVEDEKRAVKKDGASAINTYKFCNIFKQSYLFLYTFFSRRF